MNEFYVAPHVSKTKRIISIIIAIYLAGFCIYFSVSESISYQFDGLFYLALTGFILALIIIWLNVLKMGKRLIKMNDSLVVVSGAELEWTRVNEVYFGYGYIDFFTNAGKNKHRMDLDDVTVKDTNKIKSAIVDICNQKNIPYHKN